MKKYYLFVVGSVIVVLLINLYFLYSFYNKQVIFQKKLLTSQSEICINDIETSISTFESTLNKILFYDNTADIFLNEDVKERTLRKLEIFYSTYGELINNISLYDQNRNVLNLYQDKTKNFLVNVYVAQRQLKLEEKEKIHFRENQYQYILPEFENNQVIANLVVTVDLVNYIQSFLKKYQFDNINWQWIINDKGNMLSYNLQGKIEGKIPEEISKNISNAQKGFRIHTFTINQKSKKVLTVYNPIVLLKQKFGVQFSFDGNIIYSETLKFFILSSALSILILIISLLYLLIEINRRKNENARNTKLLYEFTQEIENLPIGVIIFDSKRKIKLINKSARSLLFIKDGEEMTGMDISERFLVAKNYPDEDHPYAAFDTNQFILYQQEGNEVVVYKKDTGFVINGEDIFLEAFIDVTAIEKARKYESAANTAKSEFLAKMSHEIRTPMNGIIGMTDALDQDNLNPAQKEYIQIVKKSADLLLSIIDDILDFSKIESGKMQLEEIPFKLSEELKLCLDLFRPIIREKNIELAVHIDEHVPDNLIGDPFRLRQVLSNLISNSVKFTHEGKIIVSVRIEESYNGNITLQFYVEDTGVGIPKEKLESIFNSFTQADDSTSRKYGGSGLGTTIAKQLVNLMHGEIWVESPSTLSTNTKYPGSKFSFTVEVYSNERLSKNINLKDITKFNQLKVLIISKNEESKKRLASFLDLYKINHKTYKYQDDKIDKLNDMLNENYQEFNILIIIDEPNFNGIQIAKNLLDKKIIEKFLVFMVSSNHKPDNYILSKHAGIDYYLVQPFEQEEFIGYLYENLPSVKKVEIDEGKTLRQDIAILVAEDNLINQKVAETIFKNLGYEIDIAADGKKAVEMVKQKQYDVIFMDLLMPEKDGIQATVDIRGLGFQIPIVAMTATESKKGRYKSITAGMNDYVVKPVNADIIKRVLYKWFS